MINNLRNDGRTKGMEVYMRSIHYNSMGYKHTACPPLDWRSPPVIDAYNIVIRKVCQEMGIPFLDTSHIGGPMWDSAPDWSHLSDAVSKAELLYLAAAALGIDNNDRQTIGY